MNVKPVTMNEFSNIAANNMPQATSPQKSKKVELIDKISDAVVNPRDVNDCVAVPRGIFKAYMCIMSGSGLLAISGYLPKKMTKLKKGMAIVGTLLNIASAWFFAKPFAIKGQSPTVKKADVNK